MTNRIPEPDVIGWLMEHCQRDRVLFNALNNHRHRPAFWWDSTTKLWEVAAQSQTGALYRIQVIPDKVTGEPARFNRSRKPPNYYEPE